MTEIVPKRQGDILKWFQSAGWTKQAKTDGDVIV